MTTPTILQSVFSRTIGTAASMSATLANPPTTGNAVLLLQVGDANFGAVTPPLPFVQSMSISGSNAIILTNYYKASPPLGTTYSVAFTPSFNGFGNMAVFELQNARLDCPSDIIPTLTVMTAATTVTTPALTTAVDSGGIRFAVMAWQQPVGIPTPNPPTGWTLLSPTTWMPTTGSVGGGAIWQIPNNSTGSQSLTFSATPGYAVYLDLQVMQASVGSKVVARADLASGTTNYVGKTVSLSAPTPANKTAFQSTTSAFYGSSEYLAQWSPAASSKAISGTIVENGVPVSRLVRLRNKATGNFIAQTFSNALTGSFSFAGLNPNTTYQVLAFDFPQFNAQVYDNIVPV